MRRAAQRRNAVSVDVLAAIDRFVRRLA